MSDYLGAGIRSIHTGKIVGELQDFTFKLGEQKIRGVIGTGNGLLKKKFFVPIDAICSMNEDEVKIDNTKIRMLNGANYAEEYGNIIGQPVQDSRHYYNGKIAEIYFSPECFDVFDTTIKRGILDDIITGRETVPVTALSKGENGLIIVSRE